MVMMHDITGGDFANAGNIASAVKRELARLNIDRKVAKKVVIALYEAEVNVVAHAWSGTAHIEISPEKINIVINDSGPGIADVDKAMEEGFSTASPKVREMGFGAGMGLANMKKNTDMMKINSQPGIGTRVELITFFRKESNEN